MTRMKSHFNFWNEFAFRARRLKCPSSRIYCKQHNIHTWTEYLHMAAPKHIVIDTPSIYDFSHNAKTKTKFIQILKVCNLRALVSLSYTVLYVCIPFPQLNNKIEMCWMTNFGWNYCIFLGEIYMCHSVQFFLTDTISLLWFTMHIFNCNK